MDLTTFATRLEECLNRIRKDADIIFEIEPVPKRVPQDDDWCFVRTKDMTTQKKVDCFSITIKDRIITLQQLDSCFSPTKENVNCIIRVATESRFEKIRLLDDSKLIIHFEPTSLEYDSDEDDRNYSNRQFVVINLAKFSTLKYGTSWYSEHFGFERVEKTDYSDIVSEIVKTKSITQLLVEFETRFKLNGREMGISQKLKEEILNVELTDEEQEENTISQTFKTILNKYSDKFVKKDRLFLSINDLHKSIVLCIDSLVDLTWYCVVRLAGGNVNEGCVHYELDLTNRRRGGGGGGGGGGKTKKKIYKRKRKRKEKGKRKCKRTVFFTKKQNK